MFAEKNGKVDSLVEILWNYHRLGHVVEKADLIFCLGSHDVRVAERAAQLYLDKFAPKILFSGGFGRLTRGTGEKPEADVFAEQAVKMGVPVTDILIENRSTNSGENITLGYEMLKKNNIHPKKIILVQKPYMERRAYATFKKQWPGGEVEIFVTSPQIALSEYASDDVFRDKFINAMVGDTQRMKLYAERGFQIPQQVPDEVEEACRKLINLGYDKQLMK